MPDYRLIPVWEREGKTCCRCGTKLSVKYKDTDGNYYCNRCILSLIEATEFLEVKDG